YAPEDFDRYIAERIRLLDSDPPAPTDADGSPAPATSVVDATAAAMLPFVLRHRSMLHAVDLHRVIAAEIDEVGRLRLPSDLLISNREMLTDLSFQVAIEPALDRADVQMNIRNRPAFRQTVHDALYYLPRQRSDGFAPVAPGPDGREPFRAYLIGR